MLTKRTLLLAAALVLLVGGATFGWFRYAAPTRIGFVNYMDFMYDAVVEANDNRFIRTEQLALDADTFRHARRYDALYVFAHGNVVLSDEQKSQIADALAHGTAVIFTGAAPGDVANSLDPEKTKYVLTCIRNGGQRNAQRLLNYTRAVFDGKKLFVDAVTEPFVLPKSYFYHLGDEEVFAETDKYLAFLKSSGRYREGAKNVVILAAQFGATSDASYIAQLVKGLEAQGHNVFPLAAFGPDRLRLIETVKPNLILFTPHGRFGDDKDVAWLQKQNVPLLCPIVVFGPEDEWRKDLQGMSGGMLSQAVTLPEVDGGAVPFVLAAQVKNERGLYVFRGIERRIQTFIQLTQKWLALQSKPNAEKKVAIFYYKGPGQNALVAEALEVGASLLSVLQRLQKEGYATGPLPTTAEELQAIIQQRGPVFGTYAQGSVENFLTAGQPEFIPTAELEAMMQRRLAPELIQRVREEFGPAPGTFMSTRTGDAESLAVARVPFGNVVLIPVPPAGAGEDSVALIHGVITPPPYPYIAAYLWAQEKFGADAILHFGTHGSVEFTPQKQVALSERDWPDALLAGTPHFYPYVISNPGEAMIAKRRSYAVINTHLTAPLMQSEIYGPLQVIADKIATFSNTAPSPMRDQYRESIHQLMLEAKLDQDLEFTFKPGEWISDLQIERLHHYLDAVDQEKVNKGLHILGVSYSPDELDETARLMALDQVQYKRVQLELALGRLTRAQSEDAAFTDRAYGAETARLVAAVLRGQAEPATLLDPTTAALLTAQAEKGSPDFEKRRAALAYREALESVRAYRAALAASPEAELATLVNSLNGGYVAPQPGGDPAFNPAAVPSGRNLYSINAERTPSAEAFAVAKKQVDELLRRQREKTGEYPKKVGFTLWAGEFIRQEGVTIAEIFYLLGVEPVVNARGTVHDVKLIPLKELGRPRIDVLVQTSGQFRDLAASRISLINKAVKLAAEAQEEELFPNFVAAGVRTSESVMKSKGLAPAEARALSTIRVFGGFNGAYGAGIMGLTESGDRWESEDELAQRYLKSMGAMYGDGIWGDYKEGAFEAALQNTEMIVQPRSSNTWGALSLDHVYEFMGGLSNVARYVTGKDVPAWFSDLRNPRKPQVQSLDEAVWMEARSTLLNPKYIQGMQAEGASAAEVFAETFRNTYAWDAMKSSAIDPALWDQLNAVYIDDVNGLGVEAWFREKNPYALQEMTAVMLEVVRKGYWKPDDDVVRKLATLHVQLIKDHRAGCSGFVCDNAKLRDMIAGQVDPALRQELAAAMERVRESQAKQQVQGVELKKTDTTEAKPKHTAVTEEKSGPSRYVWVLALLAVAILSGVLIRKKERK